MFAAERGAVNQRAGRRGGRARPRPAAEASGRDDLSDMLRGVREGSESREAGHGGGGCRGSWGGGGCRGSWVGGGASAGVRARADRAAKE